jgi:hypothetical protein
MKSEGESERARERVGARAAAVALGLAAAAAAGAGCGGGVGICSPAPGVICTIAGTGTAGDGTDNYPALATNLYLPQDVTISPAGRPFIVDWNNHRIRELGADGKLHIVAGSGELGMSADDPTVDRLNHPTNVTFDADGHLVIAAWHNSRVEIVLDPSTGQTTDIAGTGARDFSGDGGPALQAALNLPVAVVYDAAGDLIISDQANERLRMVDRDTQIIHTIAGTGACMGGAAPCDLGDGGPALSASFSMPQGQSARPGGRIDIDAAGDIFVADTSNLRLRKIDAAGIVTTVAGTGAPGFAGDGGPAVAAQLSRITDVAAAPDGSLYIADNENSCIRVVHPDGTIATAAGICGEPGFAGDGDLAVSARLDRPYGVALDGMGNLYIADTHNQRVRVVYH